MNWRRPAVLPSCLLLLLATGDRRPVAGWRRGKSWAEGDELAAGESLLPVAGVACDSLVVGELVALIEGGAFSKKLFFSFLFFFLASNSLLSVDCLLDSSGRRGLIWNSLEFYRIGNRRLEMALILM